MRAGAAHSSISSAKRAQLRHATAKSDIALRICMGLLLAAWFATVAVLVALPVAGIIGALAAAASHIKIVVQ